MKYVVDFTEKATVRREVQCLVEANDEQEAKQKVMDGDYEFIDSWDEDEMGADIVSIDSIVEDTEDDD